MSHHATCLGILGSCKHHSLCFVTYFPFKPQGPRLSRMACKSTRRETRGGATDTEPAAHAGHARVHSLMHLHALMLHSLQHALLMLLLLLLLLLLLRAVAVQVGQTQPGKTSHRTTLRVQQASSTSRDQHVPTQKAKTLRLELSGLRLAVSVEKYLAQAARPRFQMGVATTEPLILQTATRARNVASAETDTPKISHCWRMIMSHQLLSGALERTSLRS